MTFPLVCYCIAVPWPVVLLLKTLDRIRSFVLTILHHAGAYRRTNPPPAPPAPPAAPSSIKAQLPVVEFASFVKECIADEDEASAAVCIFCLEGLELEDEVRKLGNCRHAFHKECIDQWLENGQVNCPMCRSDILPNRWGATKQGLILQCVGAMLTKRRHHNFDHDN
ncbi:E3 ubiquitin-protein ligase [Canna indica]|uniref:E3 ubiquitin-protein ligase n=1 Tax=Canna indica TaxID=4628 RepID=A0AAQ3KHR3_9LILI|nr:E3 ubiquitin-protein ligase [Canna indica]